MHFSTVVKSLNYQIQFCQQALLSRSRRVIVTWSLGVLRTIRLRMKRASGTLIFEPVS